MRRTASEVIRSLEMRIAHLESKTSASWSNSTPSREEWENSALQGAPGMDQVRRGLGSLPFSSIEGGSFFPAPAKASDWDDLEVIAVLVPNPRTSQDTTMFVFAGGERLLVSKMGSKKMSILSRAELGLMSSGGQPLWLRGDKGRPMTYAQAMKTFLPKSRATKAILLREQARMLDGE